MSTGDPAPSTARARRALLIVGVVAVPALAFGPAVAQTTSGWPQFQGGADHSGVALEGPEPPYELLWHASVEPGGPRNNQGLSAPVIAGELVIAVAPEEVIAFDVTTGTEAWSVPRTLGPPSPPAVAEVDGRQVLLFTEGWAGHPPRAGTTGPTASGATASPSPGDEPSGPVDARLVAVDLKTQEQVWEPIELTDVSHSGVTVDGERAYVADARGELFAIDLTTGDVPWSVSIDRTVDGPAAVADGAVVVTGRGNAGASGATIAAFESNDGSIRWRQVIDSPAAVFPSAPSVGDDLAIVAFSDTTVRAFALDSGDERWSSRPGTTPTLFESAVAQRDDAVYMSDSIGLTGSAYRLDRTTGDVVWDFAINEPIVRGAPVLVGDALLIATNDGSLNALDPSTGERIWRDVRTGSLSSLAVAGAVVVGVRGGDQAGLDAFGPDPSGQLVREASPTTPDYPSNLSSFAIAAIAFSAVALAAGKLLSTRMGPAFGDEDEEQEE